MIKHYIKSALMQAKSDRLFTGIYIAGVTLAIATTLAMSMIYYIKIAPIYPEVNRGETYYVSSMSCKKQDFMRQSYVSYSFIKNVLKDIDGIREAAAYCDDNNKHGALLPDGKTEVKVQIKPVDDAFFRVYEFNFLQGSPFTAEDIEGEVKEVILADQAVDLIFGKGAGDVVGETVTIDQTDYRVKGVVEGASPMTNASFSQIYMPIAMSESEKTGDIPDKLLGNSVAVLLIDDDEADNVRSEILRRLEDLTRDDEWKADIYDAQPMKHIKSVFVPNAMEFSWWMALKNNLLVLLVLLLVPALNLAGLISGRMDARVGELGLRKAFGAEKCSIMSLVISENMVYTLIGGVLGLILAVVIVLVGKMPLVNMMASSFGGTEIVETVSVTFRPEMFLSFTVFAIALAVCLVLNVISAIIPAAFSVRRPIVESLNEKK